MMELQQAYATRDFVVSRLEEDLLGGPSDAQMTEAPTSRFVVGVLYPEIAKSTGSAGRDVPEALESDQIDTTQDGDAGAPDVEGEDEPVVSLAHVRHPRTMGLTFAVEPGAESSFMLAVTAARYRPSGPETETTWVREELAPDPITVDPSVPMQHRRDIVDGLEMRIVVREPDDGVVSVTAVLVNTQRAEYGERDERCWFDPRIEVTAEPGVLVHRPDQVVAGLDDAEVASQRLLFRDVHAYAVGHGCGVDWNDDVTSITTAYLPRHELLLSNPAGLEGLDLGMEHLAESTGYDELQALVDDYRSWIGALSDEDLSPEDAEALDRHRAEADRAAERMQAGIDLLRVDPHVRRSFRLMNLAMAQQRSRQDFHRAGGIGDPPGAGAAKWRPFQIAFILVNLDGLARPESPDREVADLLWFPTGGGKTEAYLGLIAITILLRRLRDPHDAGVSVIMRYTLRLLTLQQYERATGLICALEALRPREIPEADPISIGLWVGRKSTPNSLADARAALGRQRSGRQSEDADDAADPVQLRRCPWCGTTLTFEHYVVLRERMEVRCPNDTCWFRNGLPVHIVDSDVYRERPSLVIGTVDKFAMMAWKEDVGNLFGADGADSPPDLIVQDELHLISGPLGTVVGLYETAVDAACSRVGKPKLVASTATIRRATDQVRAVFARRARQFPPPGRSYRDSYFAVEVPREQKATRQYIGVMAAGTSHTTLMVRVYASLLQSGAMVEEGDPGADLYWTLLGYFNSLRILGGAYIQVIDDVPAEMAVLAARRGEEVRSIAEPRQMNSRKKSTEIPEELRIMERSRGEVDAADTVLATNMISVGVDVDRLGLMAVMGQPQTTAEYIQATSRVGRRMPGLVVTILNAARTRDLSHYENFAGYHRMLYRHVEATGATPFAPRARDRALHGVLVALARLTIPSAAASGAAGKAEEWEESLRACVDVITRRATDIRDGLAHLPDDESPDRVRTELDQLVDEWLDAPGLDHYEGWFGRRDGALLVEASSALTRRVEEPVTFPVEEPPWPTLTSMRDVDAESKLFFARRRRSSRGR